MRIRELTGSRWPLTHSSLPAGRDVPPPSRASEADLVPKPRAPDSQASAPQTTRFGREKLKLWVNTFWMQRVVSPVLRDNPLAFQDSDKFCNEKIFHFSPPCFPNLIAHRQCLCIRPTERPLGNVGMGTSSAAFFRAGRPHVSGSLKVSKHATFLMALGHGKSLWLTWDSRVP